MDGSEHVVVHLVVDEAGDAVLLGEAVDEALFVLRYAIKQITSDPGIERAVRLLARM